MKLTYSPQDDRRQLNSLTLALLQSQKGKIVSGMSARVFFTKTYGLDIDQHEWANTLDYMSRIKEATYANHNGGDTQYLIAA